MRSTVPVVSLELVDPRFYHLDTAIAILDDGNGDCPGRHRVLPGRVQPPQPAHAA